MSQDEKWLWMYRVCLCVCLFLWNELDWWEVWNSPWILQTGSTNNTASRELTMRPRWGNTCWERPLKRTHRMQIAQFFFYYFFFFYQPRNWLLRLVHTARRRGIMNLWKSSEIAGQSAKLSAAPDVTRTHLQMSDGANTQAVYLSLFVSGFLLAADNQSTRVLICCVWCLYLHRDSIRRTNITLRLSVFFFFF